MWFHIQDQSFNNYFENDTMKLSVNETKFTGCKLGTVLLFNKFEFENLPLDPKSFRLFKETGPRAIKRQGGGERG